jgi:HNH endonuclease
MQNDTIIIENAVQLFDYDPETGVVSWKVDVCKGKIKAGTPVRGAMSKGYRVIKLKIGNMAEHRVAWFLHYKKLPECQIDHIDRDRANNRISNLRLAPRNERDNSQNTNLRSDNMTGVAGICWFKLRNKWRARIMVEQKDIHLGLFESFEDAVAARRAAELKYFTFVNP